MRAFRYRYGAVLRRAEQAEQVLQAELAQALASLADAQRRVAAVDRARLAAREHWRSLHSHELDMGRIDALRADLKHLEALLSRAESLRQRAEAQARRVRRLLLDAARRRKLLESHRSRLEAAHRAAEAALEMKTLDDLANARHAAEGRRAGDDE